ncbi:MAG: NUDIX hydrolase [Acidobacteria bacterium]|nr:NUDIX hydrolase [Acidobacteriota bacterium]
MKPQTLSSKTLHTGKVFDVREDQILENDFTYKREIVVHAGSAVIVPVGDDNKVILVRQYRHAAGQYLLEIPAGTLNKNEDPQVAAARELEEEIGVTAAKMEKLSEFYVSPGFLTEKMHLFLATGLTQTAQKLEEDEILTLERHSFDNLLDMIEQGQIPDAKTIIGIMLAERRLGL